MLSDNKGFTILELLMIISIIGILATSMLANLLSSRERAFDTMAQSYLYDVVTLQNIYLVDNFSYTTSISDLTSLGLKPVPVDVSVSIVDASAIGYCITAQHDSGSGRVFHATSLGIKNSLQESVCTSAT